MPLDDAYIHFQFARAFARLEPLVYVPGEPAVAGATSLLWPALLAPAALLERLLGLEGQLLVALSFLLGFGALGLLAHEAFSLTGPLTDRASAWLAALFVLAFGGHLWCAGSGMEVVPLAFLLLRAARRTAEAFEGEAHPRELLLLAWLGPLLRPEGALATLLAAAALGKSARDRRAPWTCAALAGALLPPLFNWIAAGSAGTTTSHVKWLPLNPYLGATASLSLAADNVRLFFATLLNGELWSALALPEGSRFVAWLTLPALLVASFLRQKKARGFALLVVALGILLPATYETFLVNRLRYLWPFAAPWLVGLACLAWLVSEGARRLLARAGLRRPDGAWLGRAFGLACALLLAERGHRSIEDLAESAAAIDAQQGALGKWANEALPEGARVGVNDAGALTFFSARPTFDVIGLTTASEGRHWVAGAGSRFEHYERLPESARPTHFIVYPEWFALDALLGEELAERTVHSTILGGPTMRAHRADYRLLGSGETPADLRHGAPIVDSLDVADLESEAAHGYELFRAAQRLNVLVTEGGMADGGRAGRTLERFRSKVARGGSVVLRAALGGPTELRLSFAGGHPVVRSGDAGMFEELAFDVPEALFRDGAPAQTREVWLELHAGAPIVTLHYWSLAQLPTEALAPAGLERPAPP